MDRKPADEGLAQSVKELEQDMPQHKLVKEITTPRGKCPNHGVESKSTEESDNFEFDLESIINVEEVQSIMDDMYPLTNMLTAIMDLKGKVVISVGWQDICLNFHRKNPETAFKCRESDLLYARNAKSGEFIEYKCKNGLWEVFTPLYVGTRHIGNVYTGQFFYDDSPIDEEYFIKQAEKYGFDKDAYLTALRKVPIFSREAINHLMGYLVKFTTYVSRISFFNMQLQNEIHERKQAENALKKSETHLKALIDTIPDLVWLKDVNGVYLSCNPRFESFFGAKEKDIIGKTDYDFVDKELADFFRKKDKISMANRKASINEEEIPFADDGHREILETIKTPIYGTEGQLAGVLGIGRDITKRKQAEEALRKSEALKNAIINNSPDCIKLLDLEGNLMFMSKGGQERLEIKDITVYLNKKWTDFWQGKENINARMAVDAALKGGIGEFQGYSPTETGIPRWWDVVISPIRDDSGEVEQLLAVSRDITRQKKMGDQLQQGQKMEAVGTLAGGIAHDFNNILAIILGNAELASDDVSDPNMTKECLKEIRLASARAKDMVRQLLSFSRKTDEVSEPIDMAPILKESVKMLRHAIPTSVEFKNNISGGSFNVMGDATQINQIMMNLVTNAADAMSEKGGLLEVTLEDVVLQKEKVCFDCVISPGIYVRLRMRDTGEGIAPEIVDRIFEPYYTTKELGKGTGMGLSVIHGIVKRHGGGIRVESELGKGTLFEIYFPALENAVAKEKELEGEIRGGSERIIFVDDEESIVNLNRQRLERLGYQVKTTTKPVEALEWFKTDPDQFDVIITDMTMPRMTGDRLAAEILKIRPHIPVIICTGYSERMSESDAMDLGVRKYIEKPIGKRNLAKALRDILDEK